MATVVTLREASLVDFVCHAGACPRAATQFFRETDPVRCAVANCGTWLKQAAQVPRHLISARSINCL